MAHKIIRWIAQVDPETECKSHEEAVALELAVLLGFNGKSDSEAGQAIFNAARTAAAAPQSIINCLAQLTKGDGE